MPNEALMCTIHLFKRRALALHLGPLLCHSWGTGADGSLTLQTLCGNSQLLCSGTEAAAGGQGRRAGRAAAPRRGEASRRQA